MGVLSKQKYLVGDNVTITDLSLHPVERGSCGLVDSGHLSSSCEVTGERSNGDGMWMDGN